MKNILGILGGMGPLASADFLRTIYELDPADVEQEMRACVLLSDPSIPDRTETLRSGSHAVLAQRVGAGLEALDRLGAKKIVIACVTSHAALPMLSSHLRRKVISLLDLVVDAASDGRRRLLLCTAGAREAEVFPSHPRWDAVASRIVLPDAGDQRAVQELIYAIKAGAPVEGASASLSQLVRRYDVDSWVAGCTELHVVTRHLRATGADRELRHVVDPLLILARDLGKLLASA